MLNRIHVECSISFSRIVQIHFMCTLFSLNMIATKHIYWNEMYSLICVSTHFRAPHIHCAWARIHCARVPINLARAPIHCALPHIYCARVHIHLFRLRTFVGCTYTRYMEFLATNSINLVPILSMMQSVFLECRVSRFISNIHHTFNCQDKHIHSIFLEHIQCKIYIFIYGCTNLLWLTFYVGVCIIIDLCCSC